MAWVHPATALGELVDRAGLALSARGSAAMVEPTGHLTGEHLRPFVFGDVGDPPLGRDAVDVGEGGEPERLGVDELHEQGATLAVADRGHRVSTGDVVEDGGGVAQVGVPRVQVGMVAVAVTALVPTDHPPAAIGEQWREPVERPSEVEASVSEHQWWCVGVAPLVEGDADASRVDAVLAVWHTDAGQVEDRRGGHEERLGSASTLARIRHLVPRHLRPDRLIVLPALAVVLVGAVACGGESTDGLGTLPPIRTTTTSTTSTTLFDETIELYTVKRGENLTMIADGFGVPLAFLIEANEDVIDDPNNVPPGVTLKIPPYRIVDELPTTTTTEAP